MNFNTQRITQAMGRGQVLAQKNSPHLLFAAGIVGTVTSAVLACRATLKLEKEIDAIKLDMDQIRDNRRAIEETDGAYTKLDYQKDLLGGYTKNSLKVVKFYAPSIILGSASIACLAGSHAQLTRRNAALTSTLALVSQAFDDYRGRVREEVGDQKELELYHCLRDNEIEVDGKNVLVKVQDNPDAPKGYNLSPFAACFDQRSNCWKPSVEANESFLRMMQWQANERLKAFGIVFLNDVLESLGLPKTQAGQIYGWVNHNPDPMADGYIDFGVYRDVNSAKIPFNRALWLDFNVDGPVHHMLG